MKNILIGASFMVALLCGAALAQSTSPSAPSKDPSLPQGPQAQPAVPAPSQPQPQPQPVPQPAPQTTESPSSAPTGEMEAQPAGAPKIAPGSVIPVQLTKTIDAKKVKTGDEVVAKVTQDMKTSRGDVLVPKDTKVVGHVTEAQARSKEQKESQVGIAFDRAVMKRGEVPLPMSIQAIIGQQNNNSNANAPAGNEQPYSAPAGSAGGGTVAGGSSGRTTGMGGSTPAPTPSPSASAGDMPSDSQNGANAHPPITAQTQGVVGISNLTLSMGPNGTQGSVVTSDKNNVKLESGTLLLLRVNQ